MESNIVTELKDVSVGYNGKSVIGGISMRITRGALVGFVGPNGGGKTTLVKTMLGLIPPIKGTVDHICGITFGYVPQSMSFDRLFPLSVREIITMGCYSRIPFFANPGQEDDEKVIEAAKQTGIEHLIDHPYRSLSGGEKQRALLARAIVSEPDLMVLDEPTSSVDKKGESEIMSLIVEMKASGEFAIIIVSHHMDSLIQHAEKIAVIDKNRNIFSFVDKEDAFHNAAFNTFLGQS